MKYNCDVPLVVLIAVAFIAFVVGGLAGGSFIGGALRKQAVERGFAAWVLDANGIPEFRWKGGTDE